MDNDNEKKTTCECEHCHCEIPVSAAVSPESTEYIIYFCGKECLKKWEEHQKPS